LVGSSGFSGSAGQVVIGAPDVAPSETTWWDRSAKVVAKRHLGGVFVQ
jgi:hypothetical protein